MKSTIFDFYNNKCRHIGSNLFLNQLLNYDNNILDGIHGYMHWIFPLRKPSNKYGGPILSNEELIEFKSNKQLRKAFLQSFNRFLDYFGFTWKKIDSKIIIVTSTNANDRFNIWLYQNSLHFNSITRILQSLMLLGFHNLANKFYLALSDLYEKHQKEIGKKRYVYWTQAVKNKDYWDSST